MFFWFSVRASKPLFWVRPSNFFGRPKRAERQPTPTKQPSEDSAENWGRDGNRARRWGRFVLLAWTAQMLVVTAVVAQTSNQRDLEREAATATANVLSLAGRVFSLEQDRAGARLATLEALAEDARDTRRLLYGVIGGVAVQLLLSAAQLKKKPE